MVVCGKNTRRPHHDPEGLRALENTHKDRDLIMLPQDNHPPHSAQGLALKFLRTPSTETTALYGQLLQCPLCTRALRELNHWTETLGHPSPKVAPEYVTRYRLYEQLLSSPKSREETLREDSIFHTWGLCTLFLEQSSQALERDSEFALELASTGLDIARRLSEDFYTRHLVQDQIAKAHMQVLEAQLQLGRSREGMATLGKIQAHLQQGTGDPKLQAAHDHVEARLLTLLGATKEALRILDRGLRLSLGALRATRNSLPIPSHPRAHATVRTGDRVPPHPAPGGCPKGPR